MPRGLLLQSIAGNFNGQYQKLKAGTPVADTQGNALLGDIVIGVNVYNPNNIEGSATPTVTVPTGADSVGG
jgi:hypothetical protein